MFCSRCAMTNSWKLIADRYGGEGSCPPGSGLFLRSCCTFGQGRSNQAGNGEAHEVHHLRPRLLLLHPSLGGHIWQAGAALHDHADRSYEPGCYPQRRGLTVHAVCHNVLQELSLCLRRRNTDMEHAVVNCFTRFSGNLGAFMHGAARPTVGLV
jgi:hypothetical protein